CCVLPTSTKTRPWWLRRVNWPSACCAIMPMRRSAMSSAGWATSRSTSRPEARTARVAGSGCPGCRGTGKAIALRAQCTLGGPLAARGRHSHRTMTLTELRYIVAVARERHFGRAAEACFVSQPTLSVAVKKLEDELDVRLFERGSSEITVTPLGEEIVRQAQSVLEQAAEVKEIAKRGKDPLAGPLRLGVIYTIGPYLLPDLVRHAIDRVSQMPLILQENFTAK